MAQPPAHGLDAPECHTLGFGLVESGHQRVDARTRHSLVVSKAGVVSANPTFTAAGISATGYLTEEPPPMGGVEIKPV